MPDPIKSARTRFRSGSRTSPPRNVTLVQAVWAKIGPIIDFPKIKTSARPPAKVKPGCAICELQSFAHESHHADVRAALVTLQPSKSPTTTTPASAAGFAKLNVFSTTVPNFSPRAFVQINHAIKPT